MVSVESRISKVMVYTDRAQVTRRAELSLDAGVHELLFDNLPETVEENSVRAEGTGPALLREINFRTVHLAESSAEELRRLLDEKQSVEDEIVDFDDSIARANSERSFLDAIVAKLTHPGEDTEHPADSDPERWMRMVEFYRSRLETIDQRIREQERAGREARNRLDRVERELQTAGGGGYRVKHQAVVLLETKESAAISLDLVYVVHGPSWYPTFDLRVHSERKMMTIAYNAQVRQATGEDWLQARIALSTARPSINGEQPGLSPWHIGFPRPRYSVPAGAPRSAAMAKVAADGYEEANGAFESAAAPEEREIEFEEADVEANLTSVVFTPAGENSIPGDNLPHRVNIMLRELPVEFRYSSTPKLSPYAYLRAKAVNDTGAPLLPGEAYVFLDGSYVASSRLPFVSPGEEFWTSLGIDESMKIEYKLLNRFHKDEGLFAKRSKLVFQYRISVTNNRKSKEAILIRDQLPVSTEAEIAVTLLEPAPKSGIGAPTPDEEGTLEWLLEPDPGKELSVGFSFQVEYPRERQIAGL
ncbi:mucoidy inhibitor MuiA family protein [Salinispira pacifica]